jgi:hypothetical protein
MFARPWASDKNVCGFAQAALSHFLEVQLSHLFPESRIADPQIIIYGDLDGRPTCAALESARRMTKGA